MGNLFRPVPNDPRDWFTDEEVAKAKAYQRPLTYLRVGKGGVALLALLAILVTEAAPRLADALAGDPWPLRLLVSLGLLLAVFTALDLPFSIYETFVHDRRWGFSTQTPGGFVLDEVKGLLLGFVLYGGLLLALWAVIRATSLWWLAGWAVFFAFSVVLAFLAPVVLMPIFNRFEPLSDEELAAELVGVARDGGVEVSGVQVMDASKRTRKDNAFFAGLGRTRRIVLFDNLLETPRRAIRCVVAHEVGHWRRQHIRRGIALGAALTLAVFVVLQAVSGWDAALDLAGVATIRDPAALPLVALVFVGMNQAIGRIQKWFSRAYERQADVEALELTGDREGFMEMMRSLTTKNLADIAPSRWAYLNASHPPPAERMALAAAWSGGEREPRTAGKR